MLKLRSTICRSCRPGAGPLAAQRRPSKGHPGGTKEAKTLATSQAQYNAAQLIELIRSDQIVEYGEPVSRTHTCLQSSCEDIIGCMNSKRIRKGQPASPHGPCWKASHSPSMTQASTDTTLSIPGEIWTRYYRQNS